MRLFFCNILFFVIIGFFKIIVCFFLFMLCCIMYCLFGMDWFRLIDWGLDYLFRKLELSGDSIVFFGWFFDCILLFDVWF